jgi:hypothetical protein
MWVFVPLTLTLSLQGEREIRGKRITLDFTSSLSMED